ncbi:peptidoglycan-binding domain-containing protein, partial [Bacillus pumilus]
LTKGAGVKAVQQALAAVYYYPDKGAKNNGIDGYYGPKTANAVKRFQLMHGLADDGIYGPKTKAALQKALK